MRCSEIKEFLHPYLDGEFDAVECARVEDHLGSCPDCQRLVRFETGFRRSLREKLRTPPLPEGLMDRIRTALDEADARGEGPVPRLWPRVLALSTVGIAAVFAGLVLGNAVRQRPTPRFVEETVRAHAKRLPVEVAGSEDTVRSYFDGRMDVPVRPPQVRRPDVNFVGARFSHLDNRDAAQLAYKAKGAPMTVLIFNASGFTVQDAPRIERGGRTFYYGHQNGYNVVFYKDPRGVGYAFASEMPQSEMLDIVASSFHD